MDPELELAIREFLEISRRFSHLSGSINRKVVEFIKSSSNEIRHVCKQQYVEDEIELDPAEDRVRQHNGHRPSPSLDPGPSSTDILWAGEEDQKTPAQDHLRDRGSDTNAAAGEALLSM